jgi:WD40 repeat protein
MAQIAAHDSMPQNERVVPPKEAVSLLNKVSLTDYAEMLNFLPDGATLACGETKGEIRLWDIAEKLTEVSSFGSGFKRLYGTALSPDVFR